jgi:hypothetical protein
VISPQFALLPELRIWNLPSEMDEDDEGSPKPSHSFCQPVQCLNNHEQPINTEKYWINHWFVNGSMVCYRYRWLNLVHPQEPLLDFFLGLLVLQDQPWKSDESQKWKGKTWNIYGFPHQIEKQNPSFSPTDSHYFGTLTFCSLSLVRPTALWKNSPNSDRTDD